MEHNTCRENLSAYLDGELPQPEKALLEAHLADCPQCRAVLGQLGTVSGIFKEHVMEPVPPSLKGEVLGGRAKPAAYPWFKPVLALSATAAGVLVILNLVKSPEQDPFMRMAGNIASAPKEEPLNTAMYKLSGAAAPARTYEDAGLSAAGSFSESGKKAKSPSTLAAVRGGAYGQAKYAMVGGLAGSSGARMAVPSPGMATVAGVPARARLAAYTVDALGDLMVKNGTRLRVTGMVGDCIDRMPSESGEAGPPGGCNLTGGGKTVILDNFDANPYRGSEITVEGAAKYCSDENKRFLCALENVTLISPAPKK